ncbi:MAG: ABC transporter substrate-binding protein [Alphaproteobacteria bacterium]|nr:ABC transporter substrate-binding protein [Alphaproteobacteria bacterium]MBU0803528.1 ABC transporter substrate-binding protein [Alphaproteobacteria bacterium]MBU0874219.1 ABC transporter substrate-binding protein [Alphaproteobacteria bacterium]MBU1402456.1 ABC transporter substrate-binding protein [Alphaproteobacteria bacterium]MBU1593097.1 ABC transporter substrate-binding protein [Alphaproteobacteria bacterium]
MIPNSNPHHSPAHSRQKQYVWVLARFLNTAPQRLTVGLVLLIAAIVTGCQSSGIDAALDPTEIGPGTSPGPAQKLQKLGRGSTPISMVLPLSASGKLGETGRRMRDGAKLAMADLGNDLITLSIEDSRGDDTLARKLALRAASSGAKAVIGPVSYSATQQLSRLSGAKRPPILALAENFAGAPGVYAVRLTETDSAAAGAAAIAAKGSRKFVLLVAKSADAQAMEKRIANSLSIYGATLVVTVPFSPGPLDAQRAASDVAALVTAPDAVIVASGSGNPLPLVAALRDKGLLAGSAKLIGTSRWLDQSIQDPLLGGAYIAALDNTETGPITGRFKGMFGYEADVDVAYAYDMVALVAGITSAVGPDGLTARVLQNSTGFRGSTGIFRFRADGASEHSMPFYRIDGGTLKQITKSVSGF